MTARRHSACLQAGAGLRENQLRAARVTCLLPAARVSRDLAGGKGQDDFLIKDLLKIRLTDAMCAQRCKI